MAALAMSERNFRTSGGSIQFRARAVRDFEEVWVLHVGGADQFHLPTEHLLEALKQAKPVICGMFPAVIVKLDEKIDIARVGIEIPADGGAEHLQPLHAILLTDVGNLLAMLF